MSYLNAQSSATFRIRFKPESAGQALAILGSEWTLGKWNPQRPLQTQQIGEGLWEATVKLSAGTTVNWSCVVVDQRGLFIKRESTPRRRSLEIEKDTVKILITGKWNNTMTVKQMKEGSDSHHGLETDFMLSSPGLWSVRQRKSTGVLNTETAVGHEIQIIFRMKCQFLGDESEDVLGIIGSQKALGQWDIKKAALARPVEDGSWEVVVNVTTEDMLFWSCIILNHEGDLIRRESLPRRRRLPLEEETGDLLITGSWNEPFQMKAVQKPVSAQVSPAAKSTCSEPSPRAMADVVTELSKLLATVGERSPGNKNPNDSWSVQEENQAAGDMCSGPMGGEESLDGKMKVADAAGLEAKVTEHQLDEFVDSGGDNTGQGIESPAIDENESNDIGGTTQSDGLCREGFKKALIGSVAAGALAAFTYLGLSLVEAYQV